MTRVVALLALLGCSEPTADPVVPRCTYSMSQVDGWLTIRLVVSPCADGATLYYHVPIPNPYPAVSGRRDHACGSVTTLDVAPVSADVGGAIAMVVDSTWAVSCVSDAAHEVKP